MTTKLDIEIQNTANEDYKLIIAHSIRAKKMAKNMYKTNSITKKPVFFTVAKVTAGAMYFVLNSLKWNISNTADIM